MSQKIETRRFRSASPRIVELNLIIRRRWYLVTLFVAPTPPPPPRPDLCKDLAVFDLGVRTPATIFSPISGEIWEPYPVFLRHMIHKRWRCIEKLQGKIATRNYGRARERNPNFRRERKKYKRSTRRMRTTLRKRHAQFAAYVQWVHRSVAKAVVRKFDAIACPKLQYASLFTSTPGDNPRLRQILRRSRRLAYALSLGASVDALRYAARQKGCIICVDRAMESGTSKTCTRCGFWNENLGHDAIFECGNAECALKINRDWNGARNNALQVIADGGFGRDAQYINARNDEILANR